MHERVETIASVHLGNERPVWIQPPRQREEARHLTLFLDGEIYRERVNAPALVAELIARDQLADSWFVYVSMHSPEARWKECPCYSPFAAFVHGELIPALERFEPELKEVTTRTLIGLSYTGLAAAFVAFARPGLIQNVISQSGSFWSDSNWLVEQFRTLPHPLPTAFYLSVGNRETQRNVRHREGVVQAISQIEAAQRARDALLATGHAVTYAEPEGFHEFNAWARALPDALRWALPRQSGAPSTR